MDLVVSSQIESTSLRKTNSIWTKFVAFIGAHDFFSLEVWRASLTELLATAFLIFSITSSTISCLESQSTDPKLLVPLAVFVVAFLFLLVTVPLSGGHMSPVFTFIATLRGLITLSRALIYVLAQCLGSIMAFFLIKSVMNQNTARKYSLGLGGCSITGNGDGTTGISTATALVLEFSCTFLVLFIGVTVAFDKRMCKELGLVMVCAVVAGAMTVAVFVSISVTGSGGYGGVGLNPARCLGAAFLEGGRLWDGHWVFWVGPFIASTVYYGFSLSLPREGLNFVDGEHDILRLARNCFRANCHNPNSHVERKSNINSNV